MPDSFPIRVRSAILLGQVFNLRRTCSPPRRENFREESNFGALASRPIENRPQVKNLPHSFCRIHAWSLVA